TDPRAQANLWNRARRLFDAERDAEHTLSAWRWRGYDGWKCGGVIVAARADSTFSQVSGPSAALYWLSLLDGGPNGTRIDVQATALSPRPKWDEAQAQWERIEADGDLRRRAGWRSRITTR